MSAENLQDIAKRVADKIKSCENILVALSSNPSVDEISAAIGLTMILNKIGKHATAIYSGTTPNTLEFLKPEETFEKNTNSLQDFIIALDKEKADHLRYKIEGDYVKVYITPYKSTITEQDLEFSQGDFNVDLVISIDVDSAAALDGALQEYGRIMHDATAVNITTNAAGRFAEMEWSDPSMSSVCEMITILAEKLEFTNFDQATATALLTGIVAATDHFSNARTTSETMAVSSKLMQAGADQQLISSNITKPEAEEQAVAESDPIAELESITAPANTGMPENLANELAAAPNLETPATTEPLIPAPTLEVPTPAPTFEIPTPTPAPAPEPVAPAPAPIAPAPAPIAPAPTPIAPAQDAFSVPLNPAAAQAPAISPLPEIVTQGTVMSQNVAEPIPETPDYGAMIDQALMEQLQQDPTSNPAAFSAPSVPAATPALETIPSLQFNDVSASAPAPTVPVPEPVAPTPAPTAPAPEPVVPAPVPQNFDIQNGSILPPPPAPAVDTTMPTMPPVVAESPEEGAFRIPQA